MYFFSHDHFGQGTTIAGVLGLWLLLAGDVAAPTIVEGIGVAIAAVLWVRLIED